jgi:germination protein M
VGVTGCGTLDKMLSLKENDSSKVADATDITEFEIVDDDIGEEDVDEVIETITLDASNDTRMTEIIAYYEDENGYLVPVNTKIAYEEGIAKATLRSLVVGSETEQTIAASGLHGVLPENTEVKGMAIKDGLCRIDFSKQILNTTSYEEEANMIKAITYTLTEYPTINKVEMLVDGQSLATLSKGYAIDTAFERSDINLIGSDEGVNYTVYYKTPDTEVAGYYVPLTFSADKVENPVATVAEKLFDGPPSDTKLSNTIPYGVNLQDVTLVGDTAVMNLGVGAVNLSEEEFNSMNDIVSLCMKQFNDVSSVEFTIDGLSFEEAGLDFKEGDVVSVFNQY